MTKRFEVLFHSELYQLIWFRREGSVVLQKSNVGEIVFVGNAEEVTRRLALTPDTRTARGVLCNRLWEAHENSIRFYGDDD